MNTKFLIVGKVAKAHGLKGELFLSLKAGRADWFEKLTELYLVSKNDGVFGPIPQKTLKVRAKKFHRSEQKPGLIVRTEEVKDRTEAEALEGWGVLIPAEWLETRSQDDFYLHEIKDFQCEDSTSGQSGKIVGFSSNGAQDVLVLDVEGREVLVPLVQDFLNEIDYELKIVRMQLPQGLFTIES